MIYLVYFIVCFIAGIGAGLDNRIGIMSIDTTEFNLLSI